MKQTLFALAAAFVLGACNNTQGWFGSDKGADSTQAMQSESAHNALLRDESITRENAYSDLFLDSAALEGYLQKEKITGAQADRMRAFYRVRNNQFAWFTSNGLTEQARNLWSLWGSENKKEDAPSEKIRQRMDSLLTGGDSTSSVYTPQQTASRNGAAARTDTANRKAAGGRSKADSAAAHRDTAMQMTAQTFSADDSTTVQTELALTAQMAKLAEENGGVITANNMYWLVPRKKMDPMQVADSILNKQPVANLGANNGQYNALKSALKPYYEAAKAGGWQPLPAARGLRKGVKSPAVTALKKRLAASGDYPAADTSNVFTDSLVMAVRTAQEQFGQAPTGMVTDSLVAELNVPAQTRLQQILVNLNRALWTEPVTDSMHIWVNIPSLELMAYGDSGRTLRMPVIVGKEGTGTMAFSGDISTVVFSPDWKLPESIVRNEILPAMKNDPGYLRKRNMEIVKQGEVPQIRQLPGEDNSLGQVKFLFPNSFDIYLHDTPHKDLFAQKNRALSHGCIRVAQPDTLAAYVLRGQGDWTAPKIAEAMKGGKTQEVAVKKPVPVSITYYTAFTAPNGKVHFRKDVYGYDEKTAAGMFNHG